MAGVWLALIAHPLLDVTTIYGTQLFLPFTDYPFGIGSIFIIDPLFTLPVLICVIVALAMRSYRVNAVGLALSLAYLGGGCWRSSTSPALRANRCAHRVWKCGARSRSDRAELILWRIIVTTPSAYLEGYYSLLDDSSRTSISREHPRGEALYEQLAATGTSLASRGSPRVLQAAEREGRVLISDLRMGMEPCTVHVRRRELRDGAFTPLAALKSVDRRPSGRQARSAGCGDGRAASPSVPSERAISRGVDLDAQDLRPADDA